MTGRLKVLLAILAALVAMGCDATAHGTPDVGSRSQVIEQLSLPAGASLLMGDTEYEMWVLPDSMSSVVSYVAPQLPITAELKNLPWCKTVTEPGQTRWLWGSEDDGISVSVKDDESGANSGGSRLAIMTGADGGFLATDCVQ